MTESDDIFLRADIFVTSLDDLISDKASDEALSRVFDNENEELVKAASLEILNVIGPRLKDRNGEDGNVDEWRNLQSMLEYVVTISSPKEMLIGLLGLLEMAKSDEFFKMIIRPLRTIFLQLPNQRNDILLWALNGIHDYIVGLPLPDYAAELEGNEKLLMENSPELIRLETCVATALNFCEPFISEAKKCKLISSDERRLEQILAISSLLMKLVERPVAYFDFNVSKLDSPKKSTSVRSDCVRRLVRMLFDMKEDFLFAAIDWQENDRLTLMCGFNDDIVEAKIKESKTVRPVGIGVLAAMIYCQGLCLDRLPQVYNSDYIFERILPFVNSLLHETNDQLLVELGVDLLGITSQRLILQSNKTLGKSVFWESQRLNEAAYQELFLNLLTVVTYQKKKSIRQLALGLFSRYLEFFEPTGQIDVIRLIFYVFECQEESVVRVGTKADWFFANKGICGYLIDHYRAQLNRELCQSNFDSPFFQHLNRMLALFTIMEDREETDLLDNFDRYMAALNLIRFLCMVRTNGRFPSFPVAVFVRLSKNFLEPLRKGLEISKAHYELDLKKCKDEQYAKIQSDVRNMDTMMEEAGKANILKSAINSFDLMMCLLVRVSELVDPCLKAD